MEDRLQPRTTGERPRSTIADEFAAEMDSFLQPSADPLEQKVEEKKVGVQSAEQELQELEARLRATEQRLAKVSRSSSPARVNASAPVRAPPSAPMQDTVADQQSYHPQTYNPGPLAQKPAYPAERPPTGRENTEQMMSHMPGHMAPEMPPVPVQGTNGSGDFVMVQNEQR